MGRDLMQSQQFHTLFFEVWKKCGSVEKKATKTSTTLFLYIIGSVVVSVDQVWSVADEVWRSVGR